MAATRPPTEDRPMTTSMPPQHKRHGVRNGCLLSFAIVAAAAVVIGVVAAALGGGGRTAGHPAATSTTTAAPVTAAPPVTDPKGKYHGPRAPKPRGKRGPPPPPPGNPTANTPERGPPG